ncbi:MAG: outer membrane protein assembly factor BamE [Methylococcaceae bacterium]|nr:outer membrane protein assembly factor BamE [Methylococcaceae bacterium]
MKKSLLPLTLLASLSLTACSTALEYLPWVYTIDIKQGNIIDQDMINQLQPNMTKRQVLYVMGSPMISDYFHKQRWDYVYSTREAGDPKIQKRVALFFNDDNLVKIEGDYTPSSKPVAKPVTESSINVMPRKLEQTIWEKITGLLDWSSDAVPQDRSVVDESNNIPVKKF